MPPQKKRTQVKKDRHGPPEEEAVTIERWIDESIINLNHVRRLYMRWRNLTRGQESLTQTWSHELSRIYKKLDTAKVALEKIASCKSVVEGDVVDIAQKALKELD
jgi:hypothetical protein